MRAPAKSGADAATTPRLHPAPVRILGLLGLLARPARQGGAAVLLPVIAFTITTGVLLTVVGGTLVFVRAALDGTLPSETSVLYLTLALLATVLLLVPLASLAGAAARLSARRRDDRLATLRLLGSSSADVRAITVVEATLLAVVGSITGIALHAVLAIPVGALSFFGSPLGIGTAWVGWTIAALAPPVVGALAALSSLLGLRRVTLTPLGIRARTDAPRIAWVGVVVGLGAVVAGLILLGQLSSVAQAFGVLAMVVVVVVVFGGGMAVLNLIGPPIVATLGRLRARRARNAAELIAGRQLAEQAGVAWRRVSGLAVISFVAVVGGVGVAFADALAVDDEVAVLAADIRTGVILTLMIAFVLLACSVALTTAAAILDDAELLRGLDRLGMPLQTMERARRITVLAPLRLACVSGAVAAGVLVLPMVGLSLLVSPTALATIAAAFAGGFAVVVVALAATRPVVRAVLADGRRGV